MALMELEINSKCLTRLSELYVIIPEAGEGRWNDEGKYPVLWLLHGATDDYTMWQRFSSIERYANKAGIAVVMPNADISFYTNTDGGRYFDFVTQELPEILKNMVPISTRREDNFIAGMSMGGFGTMKIGFTLPEKYAAMGIFSSHNFIDAMPDLTPEDDRDWPLNKVRELVFGTYNLHEVYNTEHDMAYLARKASESDKPLPKIFGCCGTADGTIIKQREFFKMLKSLKRPYDATLYENCGFHDFDFWDKWLPIFLQWLPRGEETNPQ